MAPDAALVLIDFVGGATPGTIAGTCTKDLWDAGGGADSDSDAEPPPTVWAGKQTEAGASKRILG